MQNLTEAFKKFLFADPGYGLIELDKKQGEWVVVAYAGGDAQMINVVEQRKDAHAITGSLISGLTDIGLIQEEAKLLGHETNPDILKEVRTQRLPALLEHEASGGYLPRHMTIRQMGKKSNHGGNYGIGYRRCALEWEIPEYEAKRILPLYHKAYPGVQSGFQDGIIQQLSRDRTVVNCFGRKRQFLNRVDWKNRSSKVFEQAFGFLPQSTIADLMLEAMKKIYDDVEGAMHKLEMLMQVHDSLLLQYPIMSTTADGIDVYDFRGMAEAILQCCGYLNPTMTYSQRSFQIETELKVGTCWGEMVEVEIGTSVRRLAERLSRVFKEL
jgi:hypothetical protein